MDVAQILGLLWKRRGLLVLAAVLAIAVGISVAYRPSLSNGLEKRSLQLGTGSTTLMVDTLRSAALDIDGDLTPLSARAETYAVVASSDPVLDVLARDLRVPKSQIVSDTSPSGEQGAAQRSQAIVDEGGVYRVSVTAASEQPLLQIATQAPTGDEARRLADGAARALRRYVVRQQDAQQVPAVRRVTLRQLGAAKGGTINSGANPAAAFLGGLAVFVAACILIIFFDRLRVDMRRVRVRASADQGARSRLVEVPGATPPEARGVEPWPATADQETVGDVRESRSRR